MLTEDPQVDSLGAISSYHMLGSPYISVLCIFQFLSFTFFHMTPLFLLLLLLLAPSVSSTIFLPSPSFTILPGSNFISVHHPSP